MYFKQKKTTTMKLAQRRARFHITKLLNSTDAELGSDKLRFKPKKIDKEARGPSPTNKEGETNDIGKNTKHINLKTSLFKNVCDQSWHQIFRFMPRQ